MGRQKTCFGGFFHGQIKACASRLVRQGEAQADYKFNDLFRKFLVHNIYIQEVKL